MEKIVIFALVILSCVALSGSSNTTTMAMTSSANMSTPSSTTTKPPPGDKTTQAPTSGTVSFTASAGLVVSLVMALFH